MEYQVILDDFQGPLDLLLHLIKEKEMDLQTLELSVITDQYLQYIHMMESSQLEVMSEYLVMAAQLIEMKSKMLLPKEKVQIEDEYQEDPREALIRRLIEYKRYKDVLDEIQEKYEKILADKDYLNKVLDDGAQKASYFARKTLSKVKRKMGVGR